MIFGLINKNSGPGFHRIMVPLLLMKDTDVHITNAATEETFEEKRPKIIFYNRIIGDDIIALQSKYHFKIVCDVDDIWHLDPTHISYNFHLEHKIPQQQIKHLQIADLVTTTHERLAEKIYPYNKNVAILPNAIPTSLVLDGTEIFPVKRSASRYLRVFWQGSVTHERDLDLLTGPIKRLDKNKFAMIIAGYSQEDTWDRMVSRYTNGLRLKGNILPGVEPHRYYSNYQFADVCVCPLVTNSFNIYKSNLKVLEAAHMRLPVICSKTHPYMDLPVMYVERQKDWYMWLNNKWRWSGYADALKAYCDKHFNFETINDNRKTALLE